MANILDLPRDQFLASLNELAAQGVNTDDLRRQYRQKNSVFAPIFDWASGSERAIADQGRTTAGMGLLSKEAGTTGMDALRSLQLEPSNFVAGLLSGGAQAVDAPAAAAQGLIPAQDMPMEALGTAGAAQLGGAAMTAPRGSLRAGALRTTDDIFADVMDKYPDVKLDIYGSPERGFTIGRIEVPEGQRNSGIGSNVMREVLDRADQVGAQVNLTPSDAFGGSVNRLRDFYRNLGFVENRGRNKDFSTRETMYRTPQQNIISANRDATAGAIALPAARNDAEAMARGILDLRAAGRASEVTDDMMAKADPQYMFNNTPLPMDEASRMARAEEMGFDLDAYHGGRGGYDRFDPDMATGKTYDTGTWATDEPDIAATYTGSLVSDDPAIYPLRLNTSNYGTADWANQMWGDGYPFTRIYNPKSSGLPVTQKISDISEDWQSWASTDNAARAAGSQGLTGLKVNRVVDVGPSIYSRADNSRKIPDTSTSFSIQDPTTARSRFARFDPEFRHLANLSAGIGGLGLLGYVGDQSSNPLQTPRAE
jgi:GNAT superfamily N-acetyltransferase